MQCGAVFELTSIHNDATTRMTLLLLHTQACHHRRATVIAGHGMRELVNVVNDDYHQAALQLVAMKVE